MANTHVELSLSHPVQIGNVDVTFVVRQGTQLVGTLEVSKGTVDWVPRNSRQRYQMTWDVFNEAMKAGGTPAPK